MLQLWFFATLWTNEEHLKYMVIHSYGFALKFLGEKKGVGHLVVGESKQEYDQRQ